MYSSTQKKRHGNAKRVYPFWKTCKVCSRPFACRNATQARRNTTCSPACAVMAISQTPRTHKPPNMTCPVCGKQMRKPPSHLARAAMPTCSKQCNGILRGREWVKHAHKGRSAWTPENEASARAKMSGPNNPAWRGGVTIFRAHGSYSGVRYVRCPPKFVSMARKDGYVMEHRLFVAQTLGRCLLRSEVVHHLDHDPTNNVLSNLMLFASNRAHKLWEHHGSPAPLWQG